MVFPKSWFPLVQFSLKVARSMEKCCAIACKFSKGLILPLAPHPSNKARKKEKKLSKLIEEEKKSTKNSLVNGRASTF